MLRRSAGKCSRTMNAMPQSAGMFLKNMWNASIPPAEAPIPTIGKGGVFTRRSCRGIETPGCGGICHRHLRLCRNCSPHSRQSLSDNADTGISEKTACGALHSSARRSLLALLVCNAQSVQSAPQMPVSRRFLNLFPRRNEVVRSHECATAHNRVRCWICGSDSCIVEIGGDIEPLTGGYSRRSTV